MFREGDYYIVDGKKYVITEVKETGPDRGHITVVLAKE